MIQISATACLNFYYDILQIADKSRKNINRAGESQPDFFCPVTPCDLTHSSEKHSSRTVADFDVLFSINVTNPCGYCKGKTSAILILDFEHKKTFHSVKTDDIFTFIIKFRR
ncbi:MAG: hypothetical protein BWK80_27565 [Desulfobacteraceae bacterium IS3]|nr:MAG: hypothetical protein BWK80_27565 [Desulfobacteraceae bacterium IS3]